MLSSNEPELPLLETLLYLTVRPENDGPGGDHLHLFGVAIRRE
jgi:hypothetical protein